MKISKSKLQSIVMLEEPAQGVRSPAHGISREEIYFFNMGSDEHI